MVLGSASQVPTRRRNHNGYLLRWDGDGFLFDPGEGTQRQMLFAGVPPSAVTWICITHFHGDHCLGLPGVLQRLSLDGVPGPVTLAFPAAGAPYVERLRHASVFLDRLDLRLLPVPGTAPGTAPGTVAGTAEPVVVAEPPAAPVVLSAAALRHSTPTVGWRLEDPPARTMVPRLLERAGVVGPDVARLQRDGAITAGGRRVTVDELSVERPRQRVAFVMDTGWCDGALALARDADVLICEATFAQAEADLAERFGHLTAVQAGRLAAEGGARLLVLTHFSQRYPQVGPLVEEAARAFAGEIVAAEDLRRVPLPRQRRVQ